MFDVARPRTGNIFEKLAKYLFFHAAERTFQDFLGFWSKIQFLGRKKPISGDFWPFLIIFAFELMPAGASLWVADLHDLRRIFLIFFLSHDLKDFRIYVK